LLQHEVVANAAASGGSMLTQRWTRWCRRSTPQLPVRTPSPLQWHPALP